MKKRILTIATMLFLAIMIPLTVNAATISAEPTEMKVGDIVTVTVEVKTADTKSVQFDLDFDNTKYKYVLGSAESELDSTISNLLDDDTVRVSAFNFDTNATVQKVTLKFEAISAGTSVLPFKVVDGTLEATDETGATTMEPFSDATAVIKKIEGIPAKDDKKPEYFDENGNPITKHKPTGDLTRATTKKSIAGVYTKLIKGKHVVPYALPTSDDELEIKDIKAEFGDNVDVTGLTNPVKSGDVFTLNGIQHTVLIYGDVNKDGKVTTADALIIRQYELNKLTPDEVTTITSDVAALLEDSKAVQQFVVRLRQTSTKTILDKYPVEFVANDINITKNTVPVYRGEKTLVATVSATDGRSISKELVSIANVSNVTIETVQNAGNVEIYATPNNSNTFNIIASLQGNNIENGKVTKDPTSISVEEVKTVTDIALFDENDIEITDNISIQPGNSAKIKIKYYHTYADGSKIELSEKITGAGFFNINNVSIPTTPKYLSKIDIGHLENNNSISKDPSLTTDFILLNSSDVDSQGTDILNLTVQNNSSLFGNTTGFKRDFSKNITVDVFPQNVTGIQVNGETKNNNSSVDINLYNTAQPNNTHVKEITNSTNNNKNAYYTIIDLNLLYGNKSRPIAASSLCTQGTSTEKVNPPNPDDITDPNNYDAKPLLSRTDSIIVYQNNDPYLSFDIDVKYLQKQADGTYIEPAVNAADRTINAIAISYWDIDEYNAGLDSTETDNTISRIQEGITILYGGTKNSDGTVTKNKLNVKVTCIDGRNSQSKAPTNPNVPSDSNGLDDPFADTGIDLEEPNPLLKSKSALDTTPKTTTPDTTSSADPEVTPDATPSADPETTPDTTPSADPEVTPDATPSAKPETTPESDTTI